MQCQRRLHRVSVIVIVVSVLMAPALPIAAQAAPVGELAYVAPDGHLALLDIASGRTRKLADGPVVRAAWSRDGARLAFVRRLVAQPVRDQLEVINADGTARQAIGLPQGEIADVRWDPTGDALHYSAVRWDPPQRSGSSNDPTIYPADAAIIRHELKTGAAQRLEQHAYSLDISPAGILATTGRWKFRFDLHVATADRQGKVLWEGDVAERPGAIAWSPDGHWIAMPVGSRLLLIDPAGPDQLSPRAAPPKLVEVVRSQGVIESVTWSPDGTTLVYADSPDGKSSRILRVPVGGGSPTKLADGAFPAWRPEPAMPAPAPVKPAPTVTASPIPPTVAAQRWLDEKARLVATLESVDIPTDFLTLAAMPAYKEAEARRLLERLTARAQQGNLTPEQVDAFARLTIQERALGRMLPEYAAVAATLASTTTDTVGVILGAIPAFDPIWQRCKAKIPWCDKLQQSTERLLWRLLRDTGRTVASELGALSPDGTQIGSEAVDLAIRLIEAGLTAKSDSLQDLLVDTAIDGAVTQAIMAGLYLPTGQGLIDRGVRTADPDSTGGDRLRISGDLSRAENHTNALVQMANAERQTAVSRYQDFQRAADFAKLAEDISRLASTSTTVSPLAAVARVVEIGARVEHVVIVNGPLLIANSQTLGCIDYLSRRAAEQAFDAAGPGETCRDRSASVPSDEAEPSLTAAQATQSTSLLHVQLQAAVDRYGRAVQALDTAVQRQEDTAIAQAVEELDRADEALAGTLDGIRAMVLARPKLDQRTLLLLDHGRVASARTLRLLLAVTETQLARAEGQAPQTNVTQAAQAALDKVHEFQATAAQVDLAPPSGQPVLAIRQAQATRTPDQQLQVAAEIGNVGGSTAQDVQVVFLADGKPLGAPVVMSSLPAGVDGRVSGRLPLPAAKVVTIQVRLGGVLKDSRPERIVTPVAAPAPAPAVSPVPTASLAAASEAYVPVVGAPTPAAAGTSAPATDQATPTGAPRASDVIIALALVVPVAAVGWLLSRRQRRR